MSLMINKIVSKRNIVVNINLVYLAGNLIQLKLIDNKFIYFLTQVNK